MAYVASLVACAFEFVDGSNTAVKAYLDAVDEKNKARTEIERLNCIAVYRNYSVWTSLKLACKMSNDGPLLRFCGVKYIPTAMNSVADFVIQGWHLVRASVTDPEQFQRLLDVLIARMSSVSNNIMQAADVMYNRLLEFINGLVQKYNNAAGLNNFFLSMVSYIKTNWWVLAQNMSVYIYDTMRVHFYKYVFQIVAVMTELHEQLTAMAGKLFGSCGGQRGKHLRCLNSVFSIDEITALTFFIVTFTRLAPPSKTSTKAKNI